MELSIGNLLDHKQKVQSTSRKYYPHLLYSPKINNTLKIIKTVNIPKFV